MIILKIYFSRISSLIYDSFYGLALREEWGKWKAKGYEEVGWWEWVIEDETARKNEGKRDGG